MLNIKLIDKLSFAIKTIKNKLMKKGGPNFKITIIKKLSQLLSLTFIITLL